MSSFTHGMIMFQPLLLLCLTAFSLLQAYELSIAAIFQDEAPYLKEWIEYHRMVGVEHFWLYNDSSQDNYMEVLQTYIEQGVVELVDWPVPIPFLFPEEQKKAYKDALIKARGITAWLALIDIDEFLLPMKEKTIPECLFKHYSRASAVYACWFHFGTGGIYLEDGQSILFNLKSCADLLHPSNGTGKSIVKPDQVDIDKVQVHYSGLKPRSYYYDGSGNVLSQRNGNLRLDGKPHTKFIRINHYAMRDENFFLNVRLLRAKKRKMDENWVWERYHSYNADSDNAIIDFIIQKHPEMYESFWKKFH